MFYEDNHIKIYNQDCRDMNELADESIQMVCCSPPYWGLRKYSGEQELIWLPLDKGKDCEHQWSSLIPHPMHKSGGHTSVSDISKGTQDTQDEVRHKGNLGCWCQLCGAWKGAYGLEPTPEMYIEHTIEILREIRRVLRKDGVVFWNIGDSYASGKGTCYNPGGNTSSFNVHLKEANVHPLDRGNKSTLAKSGLKPKDLVMIPFRVALEAQRDGWWVRSVIIWSKPNPMPESVTDRPTESHEYILMLTKSARYYWDPEAVREEYSSTVRWGGDEYKGAVDRKEYNQGLDRERSVYPSGGRNIRSVWEFPTKPGPSGAVRNFAVFPEKLPEICIKAATPEVGCCGKCGAPWERILDKKPSDFNIRVRDAKAGRATPEEGYKATQEEIDNYPGNHPDPGYRQTTGWQPTCKCNADKVPSIVLDPFMGAGTTLWVAKKLNRRAVGYEISEEYCRLAVDRCRQQVLL